MGAFDPNRHRRLPLWTWDVQKTSGRGGGWRTPLLTNELNSPSLNLPRPPAQACPSSFLSAVTLGQENVHIKGVSRAPAADSSVAQLAPLLCAKLG